MATGFGAQQSLRRAIGVLKDSTKVGLAKVNSENKGLDVAIVKATNHDEALPKEKYISIILHALSYSSPRCDVVFCIHGLTKRLAKTHTWTVALKTLIVIHRAVREVDPSFQEELIHYSCGRSLTLNLSHFKDDSSPDAWDYSAWVRTYALYLEERLECFRILMYDVETDPPTTKGLDTPDLLEHLPAMQQLLFRLLACKPEGAAVHNPLIRYALSIVAGESVRLYVAIADGIVNLVDKYFDMQRHDAIRALEIYKKAGSQGVELSDFYAICRDLGLGRGLEFVKIKQPPPSFTTSMEDYVKEAPHFLPLQLTTIVNDQGIASKETNPEVLSLINHRQDEDIQEKSDAATNNISKEASALDEQNSLSLAIVTSAETPLNREDGFNSTSQTSCWELELLTAPRADETAVLGSKPVGGLDRLTLDSLYDDALARQKDQSGAGETEVIIPNSFQWAYRSEDGYYASSNMSIVQQQAFVIMQQKQQQQEAPVPCNNPFVNQTLQFCPAQNSYPGLI